MPKVWTIVTTSRPDEVGRSYLYGHSRTFGSARQVPGRDRFVQLVLTEADTLEHAERLAEVQAMRLRSGLHGARVLEHGENPVKEMRQCIADLTF